MTELYRRVDTVTRIRNDHTHVDAGSRQTDDIRAGPIEAVAGRGDLERPASAHGAACVHHQIEQ